MGSRIGKTIQVGFTYIGTVVGAGFATGQEILQFFTKFGWMATFTIALSSLLFIWLGTKLMLLAHDLQAKSYEDLNKYLFGARAGRWISTFTLIMLLGTTSVMLAGAGTIYSESFQIPYQLGLAITLVLSYLIISKGVEAILAVNSIVVPIMITFTLLLVFSTLDLPLAHNWIRLPGDFPLFHVWAAPLLYTAFNLSLAQAVLVPIGSSIKDRNVLYYGGLLGGIGIGLMLLAGHYILSAQMPGVNQFEIPMGFIIGKFNVGIQLFFFLIVLAEIYTTLIADVYGLALQVEQRTALNRKFILVCILILCYFISQIGFKLLLSTLYPLFGLVSLLWFCMMMWRRTKRTSSRQT